VVRATQVWQPSAGSTEAWPAEQWWTAFGDSELNHWVHAVLAANPTLAAAKAHAAIAAAMASGAHAPLSPQAGVRSTAGREQISANGMFPKPFGGQTFTLIELAGSLTYRLDLSGRLHAQAAAGDAEAAAASEDARRAGEAVAATTVRLYIELGGALVDLAAVRDVQAQWARSRKIIDARAAQGLENEITARRVAAEVEAYDGQVALATQRVVLIRGMLAALAGSGPDAAAQLNPPAPSSGTLVAQPKDLHLNLLGRRADVRAARSRVEAASYAQVAARRAYLPDLSFDLMGGLQSRTVDSLFESGSRQWNMGPALTLPLFDGHQRRAARQAQDAALEASTAQYRAAVVNAVAEVNAALAGRSATGAALEAARRALAEEHQSLAALKRRQVSGIAAEADVVAAQIRVLERSREVARLTVQARLADVDLIEALGGDAREESKL
jgi:NodT family efflux transporter outer membrane factor (OMF) lipoprotein